ncbi:cytochrome P450-dit2 [Aphanomyces cochlioides]|nr:cytochrome P450-dit2 [Aphanomyces cochlioides]
MVTERRPHGHLEAVLLREMLNFTVLISDPKAIQYLYSTNANNYHRSPIVENLLADFTFDPGLLSTRGAVHDNYRKMLNPLFSASQIKSFVPIYEAQARLACDTVFAKAAVSGEPTNLYTVFSDLTLRVVHLPGFGLNFDKHSDTHAAYQMAQLEATVS